MKKKGADPVEGKESPREGTIGHLMQWLMFSGALNIALVISLVYAVVKNHGTKSFRGESAVGELTIETENRSGKLLQEYTLSDYRELTESLKDKSPVNEEVSKRDLALSCLVTFYDFDISRALIGCDLQKKNLVLPSGESLSLYPDLTDEQFDLILSFLKTERWPFTSKGLFNRLVESGDGDPSLRKAFYLTKEFMLLEALYCQQFLPGDVLLDILLQGPWEIIDRFSESHYLVQNYSHTLRIEFLGNYLEYGSREAADWILKISPNLALKIFSDEKITALLSLTEEAGRAAESFALQVLLYSPSPDLKKEACKRLYFWSGHSVEEPFDYASARFSIAEKYHLDLGNEEETSFVEKEEPRLYRVKSGDCLSKIAKKFQVGVRELRTVNHLEKDVIRAGTVLVIPKGEDHSLPDARENR